MNWRLRAGRASGWFIFHSIAVISVITEITARITSACRDVIRKKGLGMTKYRSYTVYMNSSCLRAALKGRGAVGTIAHRFSQDLREPFDDGWCVQDTDADAPPATEVWNEDAKSALSHNDSPDIHFDAGLNPYRGCEHGCAYCYARPTHSYLNLSPGLDFETKIIAKRNLVEVLARELASPHYRPSPIAIGSATDAYQPAERQLRITRGVLELLHQCHHPFGVVTKGSGVERDLDLIGPMAARRLATVCVTLTTLDPVLARQMEPRAASPQRRLRTIRTLAEAGVPVGVVWRPRSRSSMSTWSRCWLRPTRRAPDGPSTR
jgi:hypothetical protein